MLYVLGHCGLGDHVITNGLIRTLALMHDQVFLPCKEHNVPSVKAMYQDNPRIHVLPVKDEQEAQRLGHQFKESTLLLGLYSGHGGATKPGWDRLQYQQAGVPFENRWSKFKIGVDYVDYDNREGVFLHDDETRGFVIRPEFKKGQITKPYIGHGPFSTVWPTAYWLENAAQVHCIDSSWLCIADSVETQGALFFHRYARPGGVPPTLRKNWTIID